MDPFACRMSKVAPIYALLLQKGKWVYDHAPKDVLQMIFGLALCFFGGTYVAAIAAVEAWRHMGWQRSYADARHVWDETQGVVRASLRDDMVDDDKNGIADVDEMTPAMLAQRKVTLAMTTVSDPDKLANSVGALWGAYLAVLATLRLEFARVVALALGIAEMVPDRARRRAAALGRAGARAQALGAHHHHDRHQLPRCVAPRGSRLLLYLPLVTPSAAPRRLLSAPRAPRVLSDSRLSGKPSGPVSVCLSCPLRARFPPTPPPAPRIVHRPASCHPCRPSCPCPASPAPAPWRS